MRSACADSIAPTIAATEGGAGARSSSASAYASRMPPALGGGFGQHGLAAVGDADRLARDGLVGGEVGAREQAAALGDPVADRLGDVAGVERRRPLGGEPLERVGQRRVAVHVADHAASARPA